MRGVYARGAMPLHPPHPWRLDNRCLQVLRAKPLRSRAAGRVRAAQMHQVTDGDRCLGHHARASMPTWTHPDLPFSVPLGKVFFLNLVDKIPPHLLVQTSTPRLHFATPTPSRAHRRLYIGQAPRLLLLLRSRRLIRRPRACLGRSCSTHAVSSRPSPPSPNPTRRPVRKMERQSPVTGLVNGETCYWPSRIAMRSNKNLSLPRRRRHIRFQVYMHGARVRDHDRITSQMGRRQRAGGSR